jgi:hypothetical protein
MKLLEAFSSPDRSFGWLVETGGVMPSGFETSTSRQRKKQASNVASGNHE